MTAFHIINNFATALLTEKMLRTISILDEIFKMYGELFIAWIDYEYPTHFVNSTVHFHLQYSTQNNQFIYDLKQKQKQKK